MIVKKYNFIYWAAALLMLILPFIVDAPAKAEKMRKSTEAMTEAEMAAYIKETLDYREEIISLIPGLKKEIIAGFASYSYEGVELSRLNKEKLRKILIRIQNESARIQTERLNQQLESIRQSQQIMQGPPKIPAVFIPPSHPHAPSTPPSAPQIPKSPPPQPQSTRR